MNFTNTSAFSVSVWIKTLGTSGTIIGYYDAIGEVYFEDGAFLVRDDHCEGDLLSDWMAGERLVIGNIYENPELLEGN